MSLRTSFDIAELLLMLKEPPPARQSWSCIWWKRKHEVGKKGAANDTILVETTCLPCDHVMELEHDQLGIYLF